MDQRKWRQILAIDLSGVKAKMRYRKGWWWCWRNDLDKIENEYREFLYLIATNPGKTVVPWSQPLDDFWHEHILDTRKYRKDCEAVIGRFVEHNPHLPKGSTPHTLASRDTQRMRDEARSSNYCCESVDQIIFLEPTPFDNGPTVGEVAAFAVMDALTTPSIPSPIPDLPTPSLDLPSSDGGGGIFSAISDTFSSIGSGIADAASSIADSVGSSCGGSSCGGGGCGGGCGGD